jgi:predicted nucleotidyltransferase
MPDYLKLFLAKRLNRNDHNPFINRFLNNEKNDGNSRYEDLLAFYGEDKKVKEEAIEVVEEETPVEIVEEVKEKTPVEVVEEVKEPKRRGRPAKSFPSE